MLKQSHLSLYTFLAVLLAITAVGAVTVPFVLSFAKQTYYRLQADVNERQAEAMTRFVTNRLQPGRTNKRSSWSFRPLSKARRPTGGTYASLTRITHSTSAIPTFR